MNLKLFKRITSSGNYIPQLDGLRFIAIISVVLFHIDSFLTKQWLVNAQDFNPYVVTAFSAVSKLGYFGVEIFFVISGYILTQPIWGKAKFNYGHYLERRVSRIEPPFLICCILFTMMLHFHNHIGFHDLWVEFLTTIFYIHNFVFPTRFSMICGVSWTLEIEVQFYLLIPLIIILIKKVKPQLAIILTLFVLFQLLTELSNLGFRSLVNYIDYFWVGVIVSFIKKNYPSHKINLYFPGENFILTGLIFLTVYETPVAASGLLNTWGSIIVYALLFLLFYNVLVLEKGIKFLSSALISRIGGMCYTIYLVHYVVINIAGYYSLRLIKARINIPLYFSVVILLAALSIIISACLFLIIEKPFMKKEWYKYGFK